MRLAISRRAAPGLPVAELGELVRSRGFDGVELTQADLVGELDAEAVRGVVVGIRVESAEALASAETASRAAALGAPVIAARRTIAPGTLAELARRYEREGARLLVSHGTSLDEAMEVVRAIADARSSALAVAWDVRPKSEDLSATPGLLLATTGALEHVRMFGGGPELGDEESVGTGGFVTSLALSGFAGVVTLTPSSEARVADWQAWLSGAARNGCGTAYEKAHARERELDIRPVEPKDRMATIMGAYRALHPGQTLRVTFDHDPSCMYFTLQATEPEGSFTFERGADGPAVWSAEVSRVR